MVLTLKNLILSELKDIVERKVRVIVFQLKIESGKWKVENYLIRFAHKSYIHRNVRQSLIGLIR